MKDLTVVVMTHNRSNFLIETINSIENQNVTDFFVLVSDNSTDDETEKLFNNHCWKLNLKYKRRKEELTFREHITKVISEINTQYFILFHDDDVMLPTMIDKLYCQIFNSDYIAVASNAYYLKDTEITNKCMNNIEEDIVLTSIDDVAHHFCSGFVNPLPSYIYDKTKLERCKYTDIANKYSDVIWICDLVKEGKVYWLAEPLMLYRLSDYQDSNTIDINGYKKLVNYWKKNTSSYVWKTIDKFFLEREYLYDKQNKRYRILHYFRKSPFYFFPRMCLWKIIDKI